MSSDPNYITKLGAKRLQDELHVLRSVARPKIVQEVADAAAQGDRSENAEYIYGKKKLREIDRRLHFLHKRLESAHVVTEPPSTDRVYFGASVEVEDEEGRKSTYRIVGEDEIDLAQKHISWKSPIGRALLKKREGDAVKVRRPNGEVELTVVRVWYATPLE